MTRVGSWPVKTAAVGQVSVGSALWRLDDQLMVTTIVKVTMGLKADARMTVIEPAPIFVADEHDGGHPMSSLRAARETAPQLQRVDVLLTGYAYPTRGAAEVDVSLAILGHGKTLLSKVLRVRGDRGPDGQPRPFERMKLGDERTYGGIGYLDNPLGTGFGSTDAAPNIVYSGGDEKRPAGFGPIPAFFPTRKRLLGAVAKRALTKRIAEIPLDFDWSYFQAAPEDQRINLLRGDEWIEIEGLVRGVPVLRSQLPGAMGVAKIYGAERAKVPHVVPLMADMLHIDAEAQSASLVWRGSFPISDEAALDTLTIAGGVELPDEPMLWPETEADLIDITSFVEGPTEQLRAIKQVDMTTTTVMTASERSGDPSPFEATIVVDGATAAADALPFEHPLAGTHSLSEEDITADSAPFDIAPAGSKSPDSSGRHIPGAPWAEASSVPEPLPIDRNLKGTVTAMHVDAINAKREADAKAKREAEATKREAEERARREAEEEAKQQGQAEAEARRQAEADRFRKEQEQAKAEEARREAEAAKKKAEAAKQLRSDIYGAFKRKR